MIARLVAAAIAVALFAYVAAALFSFLAVALLAYAAFRASRGLWRAYRRARDERRHGRAELLARADIQHRWYLAGDPRGTYGRYLPAAGAPLGCAALGEIRTHTGRVLK